MKMPNDLKERVSLGRSRSISYATGKTRINTVSNIQNAGYSSPLHQESTINAPLHSTITSNGVDSNNQDRESSNLFDSGSLDTDGIPKTLHFDSTIHHLIKRYGAVNLIRQLSNDLAQREAEISQLRRKNSLRENVMMRLLREMGFTTSQVELMIKERLAKTENGLQNAHDNSFLKDLISDAMLENLSSKSSTGAETQTKPIIRSERSDNDFTTIKPKEAFKRPHSMSSPPAPNMSTLSISSHRDSSQKQPDQNKNLLYGVVSHKFLNHMPQTFHDAIINTKTHSKVLVPVEMENFDPTNVKPPTYIEKSANDEEEYVDQYGFLYNRNSKPLKPSTSESSFDISITSKLLEIANDHDRTQKQNNKAWDSFIKKITILNNNQENDGLPDDLLLINGENISHYKHIYREFARLVSSGIPMEYRTKIWSELTGSKILKTPYEYSRLLDDTSTDSNPEAESQIQLDLYRTMPFNVFFKDDGPGLKKLQNVLIAISRKYPNIGYCQGMNFIIANLLLVYPVEEDAFWVFVGLLENILPYGFFNLVNIQNDMISLKKFFQVELPTLHEHFANIGVELDPICFNWIVSLFSDSLPIHIILRIWDNLMLNGYKEVFKISLAIFKTFEKQLLEINDPIKIYELMKNLQKVNFNLKGSDLIRLSFNFNIEV